MLDLQAFGFVAQMADFVFTANYSTPQLGLIKEWDVLYEQIAAQFDANLGNIKNESTSVNPSDFAVVFYLIELSALVRFRADRLEIQATTPQIVLADDAVAPIVERAKAAVTRVCPQTNFAVSSFNLGFHGRCEERDADSIIEKHATGSGVAGTRLDGVSFSWVEGDSNGRLILERSLSVDNGIMIRTLGNFQGEISADASYRLLLEKLEVALRTWLNDEN